MGAACPTDELVADFVARRTPQASARELEAHLDRCAACRELVSMLVQNTQPAGARGAHALEGAQIGRFVVAERLGVGGMGAVYAAYDPVLDRRVALKILHESTGAWGERLVREAQALARLAHPNVVAVYDVARDPQLDDQVFIAMELVAGATLTAWLAQRPRAWREIVEQFVQAGHGLAAAHEAGFVHRDFKPDNVLVGDDGRARVTDFGLARMSEGRTDGVPRDARVDEVTRTGAIAGTPAYMAPEQLDGEPTDARADQFAFCVALAEALTGERPYAGDSVAELRAAIAAGELREPRTDAPLRIRRALRRGLAEDPAARFPTMRALLGALTDARGRRLRWTAAAAVAATAVAAIGWRAGRSGAAPPPAIDACSGAEAELAAIWDPATKAAARAAFTATKLPYAEDTWRIVEQRLDRWAAAWSAGHADACGDSVRGEQSPDLLDRRMVCLDQQRSELRALSGAFARADRAVVERAVGALGTLSAPATCSHRETLMAPDGPPADPALRARLAAFDRELADVYAQSKLGKVREANPALDRLVATAEQLGHPPALARAQMRRARVRVWTDPRAAQGMLREALRTAETARLDAIRAEAMMELVDHASHEIQRTGPELDRALALADDTRAVIRRLGDDRWMLTRLTTSRAKVLRVAGQTARALVEARAAVAIAEQTFSLGEPVRAEALAALASALADASQLAEGAEYQRRALRAIETVLGRNHPNVGIVLYNLSLTLLEQGQVAEARTHLERALALFEAALGPDDSLIVDTLQALGNALVSLRDPAAGMVHLRRAHAIEERTTGKTSPAMLDALAHAEIALGHFDEALRHSDRALALRRALHDPEHRELVLAHQNAGFTRLKARRFTGAIPHFREMLRIDEQRLGPTSPGLLVGLRLLGETLVRVGRTREAIGVLERAVAIGDAAPTNDPKSLAAARWFLARALWESGGDRPRARRLIAAAREVAARDPHDELLAEIDPWSAAHRLK